MFRRTNAALTCKHLTGFCVFARQAWKLPKVQKSPSFRSKSRIVHAAWARLPPQAKAKFNAIGKRTPLPKKKKAPIGAWQKFVKKNYKKVARLPFKKRIAAIAKEWNKA